MNKNIHNLSRVLSVEFRTGDPERYSMSRYNLRHQQEHRDNSWLRWHHRRKFSTVGMLSHGLHAVTLCKLKLGRVSVITSRWFQSFYTRFKRDNDTPTWTPHSRRQPNDRSLWGWCQSIHRVSGPFSVSGPAVKICGYWLVETFKDIFNLLLLQPKVPPASKRQLQFLQ